jgi:protein SCO1/2
MKTRWTSSLGLLLGLFINAASSAGGADQPLTPSDFNDITLEQRLGHPLPLDLVFTNSAGAATSLRDLLGARPAILALGYHQCPSLCAVVLQATSASIAAMRLEPGEDYDFIFVSIDPVETPALAAATQRAYCRQLGRADNHRGFHFLTGRASNIEALAQAAGYHYFRDSATDQYAHPSGLLVLTPDGVISRVFPGIEYPPRDLRLALVEASSGRVGSPADRLLLLCYHYNPVTGRYGLLINRVIKAACGLTVLTLAAFVGGHLWKERRARKERSAP